jgi:FtsH-binding integral membrane protein
MEDTSDLVVGLMMAVFGLIGLFLISGATDSEMYVFGLSLSGFAILFDFGLIKRYFDRRDAIAATAQAQPHV